MRLARSPWISPPTAVVEVPDLRRFLRRVADQRLHLARRRPRHRQSWRPARDGSGLLPGGTGCLILSLPTEPWIYVLGWLVLGPAMRLILYDAAFPALAQVAREKSRRSISYLTLFGGLASTVFWPVSHVLSQAIGWRSTFLVYALLHLLLCLPLHFLVLNRSTIAAWACRRQAAPQPAMAFVLAGADRNHAMIAFAAVLRFERYCLFLDLRPCRAAL